MSLLYHEKRMAYCRKVGHKTIEQMHKGRRYTGCHPCFYVAAADDGNEDEMMLTPVPMGYRRFAEPVPVEPRETLAHRLAISSFQVAMRAPGIGHRDQATVPDASEFLTGSAVRAVLTRLRAANEKRVAACQDAGHRLVDCVKGGRRYSGCDDCLYFHATDA